MQAGCHGRYGDNPSIPLRQHDLHSFATGVERAADIDAEDSLNRLCIRERERKGTWRNGCAGDQAINPSVPTPTRTEPLPDAARIGDVDDGMLILVMLQL
jgi:hypothetical protein